MRATWHVHKCQQGKFCRSSSHCTPSLAQSASSSVMASVTRGIKAAYGLATGRILEAVTHQPLRLGVSQQLSLRSFAADQHADRKDAAPDPFLPHLQHKTEKELLDLLSKNQQQTSRKMLLDDDDEDVEVPSL